MTGLLLQVHKPDDLTQWVVLAAGVLGVSYLLLRPKFKRKDPLDSSRPAFGLSQQRSLEQQMSNLLVELSEMTRKISAQLDTRSAKLELLIHEADEKIAALHAAADLHHSVTSTSPLGLDASPHSAQSSPRSPALPDIDPRHAAVYLLADQGRSAAEIAGQLSRPSGEIELILALRPRA